MTNPSDNWDELRRKVLGLGDSSLRKTHYPSLRRRLAELERFRSKLQQSEAYLAEAQKLTHTGSWAWDPNSDVALYWSEEMFRIHGEDPEQPIPDWEAFQFVHPDDRDRVRELTLNAIHDKTDLAIEYRLLLADGTLKHLQIIAHGVLDKNGALVRYVGTAVDVTERKRAEEALRRSETELRNVIETIPAMVWSALPDGSNVSMNKRWADYTGLSATGLGWQAAVHPDDLERHLDAFYASSAKGVPFQDEVRFRRADGEYRWFVVAAVPLRDAEGNVLKWYGIVTDIEDRKRAEQALRRSEAYLAEAQRLSHTASFSYNPGRRKTLFWSEELFRIFRLDPQRGVPDYDETRRLVHPDDSDRVSEECLRGFREKAQFSQEYRLLLHDGTVKHLHVIWHPVLDKDGEVVEYVGTAADATERKEAEQALREAQAALAHVTRVTTLGEVTASFAHELNQPLAAIGNNANACLGLLKSGSPDLEEMREALVDIVNDAERGGAIIERVREMTRRSVPQRTPVRLADVVDDIGALTAAESAARGIAIHTEVAPDLPVVRGDRVQLQQVLLNLVVNAMDAMGTVEESERRLEILGQPDKQDDHPAVRISVRDHGIGLDAGEADKLFEAFYTTKAHGMGLGLAISRSIIEAHGGRLWAEPNPERGAVFSFCLPAAEASAVA